MSLYGYTSLKNTPTTTMKQFEASSCDKYVTDPYSCIDCEKPCQRGSDATKQLEKETRKPMSKRQLGAADAKLTAMNNYLEALKAPDPVRFIMEKYSCKNERLAKNKLYQWQHNYGATAAQVTENIREFQEEVASSKLRITEEKSTELPPADTRMKNESPVSTSPLFASETPDYPQEEKKMTRRQEEKISQSRLEIMRGDLEKEFLQKEAEIEEHKKGIVECEKRMNEITNQIQAIRQVLEIFRAKDKLYV